VQVIFIDQSELLINSLSKQVLYTNKYKEKSEYPLSDIMQSDNRELIKRYTPINLDSNILSRF
jgi:hypothetical protein